MLAERRILYLTDRLSLRGGADQHLLQVVRGAHEGGMEVTVAAGRLDASIDLPADITLVRIKGLASAVTSEAKLGSLDGLLSSTDLVHIQNVMNPVVFQRSLATRPTVVTVQDHRVFCPGPGKTLPSGQRCHEHMSEALCDGCLPQQSYRTRLLELTHARLEALQGARLVVLSRYMASELEAAGFPSPAAAIIPPWVEVSNDIESDVPREGFLLGGRLVAHKGIRDALRAWQLAETGQPLRVAGAGPLEEELEGTERLGWLNASELRLELRRVRALLFPGWWQEPFGILGVEALSQGTPVIVAATGGTPDWTEAGCLVVPPSDPQAMSEAMTRLAADPQLARRLGDRGRALVRKRFHRSHIEEQLFELYEEVLQRIPG